MKISNVQMMLKIFLLVVSAVIVCVIGGLVLGGTNSGKTLVNSNTSQIVDMASKNGSITLAQYDGSTIAGAELVALIQDTIEEKEPLAIVVITLEGSRTDYNYSYHADTDSISTGGTTSIMEDKAQGSYINRSSMFLCSVKKDTNDTIVCLWFEQVP